MTGEEFNAKIDAYKVKIKEIQNSLLIKYKKIIEDETKDLCRECIEEFYSKYEPKYYKRTGDLKNAFKVNVDLDAQTFTIRFGSEFMKKEHRASNDYIFDISFMQGWHGGADHISDDKEDDWGSHPNPGTPYWRTPPPSKGNTPYISWGKPAKVTTSPYSLIEERFGDLEYRINDMMKRDYSKKMKPIVNGIKSLVNEYNNTI